MITSRVCSLIFLQIVQWRSIFRNALTSYSLLRIDQRNHLLLQQTCSAYVLRLFLLIELVDLRQLCVQPRKVGSVLRRL
jgi:hypothetical protein